MCLIEVSNKGACRVKEVAEEEEAPTQGESRCHAVLRTKRVPVLCTCTVTLPLNNTGIFIRCCQHSHHQVTDQAGGTLIRTPGARHQLHRASPTQADEVRCARGAQLTSCDCLQQQHILYVCLPTRLPIPLSTVVLRG